MSLTSRSIGRSSARKPSYARSKKRKNWLPICLGLGIALFLFKGGFLTEKRYVHLLPLWAYQPPPLVMEGGDPYIRALMRTISASEANYAQPYSVLYGGQRFSNLSKHPNQCEPITAGPNKGDCTTAAGRYQFLMGTWEEKAEKYHPERSQFWLRNSYRFTPEFQDEVVYHWLSDSNAWGVDLSKLLREGRLDEVLRRLSGTWTSLGYGLETNVMSPKLPSIYQEMLAEELAIANSP